MKVVVCQGDPIGGEPSRDVLIDCWKEQFADCDDIEVVYKGKFTYDNLDETIEDADALLGVWVKDDTYNEEFFNKYPKLKYIATFAHGFGRFDREAAKRHGVTFTNTVYGDMTIAQYGMALLLDICHNIRFQSDGFREDVANHKVVNMTVKSRQIELYEKTIGIIGLGAIGFWMAKMAAGFGMKVVAYSRHKKTGSEYDFIEQISLEELYERSDVISINCPATEDTIGMINKNSISKMKDGVIIINTARGVIINEDDLKEALDSGKVYAAGLDVVQNEPLDHHIPLMDCPNAVITPHIAWAPAETRFRTVKIAAENFKNWKNGKPTSVIS